LERSAEPREALRALIEGYAHVIRAAVARIARGRLDLGDEVQQRIAEALWKRLQSEKEIEDPAAYIYRCAIRETLKLLREDIADVELETVAVLPGTASPANDLYQRRLATAIEEAFAAMAADRVLAVRGHLAGFTAEEIMRMHDWPYHKARNLIARGMIDLRAALTAKGFP
jgi:DNA-directed RNA polymerase specialized sigma24 family protein